ncbi:MAG: aminotransferase class III-fold pyridoxal phosphate-dependent enzyme [Bacteroidota bacterium]
MKESDYFDLVISSEMDFSDPPVLNLSGLLFKKLDHRDENSIIILSHEGNSLVELSLKRLRFIVFSLYREFETKKIEPGQTVLLANISGNNELFLALQFTALASYGVRVLLPMFMETKELAGWLKATGCRTILVPKDEIAALNHHENEKSVLEKIEGTVRDMKLACYDTVSGFGLRKLVYQEFSETDYFSDPLVKEILEWNNPDTEALLISTSGTSGKSKLVAYDQGSYIKNCLAWQKAGFYDPGKLGGRGFTPLFAHTMGIRAFINALWTGTPVCLINTEWFEEKPEIVRYFMLKMKPEHVTGGPAVYNLLLELMRNFPELKESMAKDFKVLISSGAPLNRKTAKEIESAFGIKLQNAYGTTETQQALCTLLCENPSDGERSSLGKPLPGISIGMKKMPGEADLYQFYIRSPFGMKMAAKKPGSNSDPPPDYFETGDIVKVKDGRIEYIGRENKDFFKDGFGVKIPLNIIKGYYLKLYNKVSHISFYPVQSKPGLAALIFIENKLIPAGKITERIIINGFSDLISEINTRLLNTLEPFEVRHRFISRFVLINGPVPKTVKGGVSQYKIETRYEEIIQNLIDPLSPDRAVADLGSRMNVTNIYTRQHNPFIGNLLYAAGLDYAYHRSLKDSLFTFHEGKEIEILDLTGGYGINLIGHNNQRIKDAITGFINHDEIALSDQGSIQRYAGLLAEELDLLVGEITGGSYYTLFGSTGSEAVEISLHHALFEWWKEIEKMEHSQFMQYGDTAGLLLREVWDLNRKILSQTRVKVIALKNSFHGNSAGARSVLGNTKKRDAFVNILALDPVFIDDQADDWEESLNREIENSGIELMKVVHSDGKCIRIPFRHSSIIAAIAEPVLGEGGVRAVNTDLLKKLSGHSFPLIMDEIQCGLGRTGTFLASGGLKADYYLFAKALGGNYEKISAVLINKSRYKIEFGEYYTSTFADGGLAAKIALETLSIIKNENIPDKARQMGKIIQQKLLGIQSEYPEVIGEITGTGLMQGIRLNNFALSDSIYLRILSVSELLGLFAAAWMLKVHRIRILPTVSAPDILRIEPSAYISAGEIDRFIGAMREFSEKVTRRQMYELFRPLMEGDLFQDNKGKIIPSGFMYPRIDQPSPGAARVALIVHFAYPADELRVFDPDMCKASDTGLRILFNRMQMLLQLKPFRLFAQNICKGAVHLSFIVVPTDVAELERLNRQNKREKILFKIQDAVNLAASLGAEVISLGGYTSILSNDGMLITEPGNAKVVTGNTLTAASGIRNLTAEINRRSGDGRNKILAVVGAAGNIGSIVTEGLLKSGIRFDQVWLFGRNRMRLIKLREYLENNIPLTEDLQINLSTDLNNISRCNIIIAATNTNDPILFAHHLNPDQEIILSDLSIPGAISKEVKEMPNVIDLPFASFITLPDDPGLVVSSHTPQGTVFCCAAEAILCGLEKVDLPLKGRITREAIEEITRLAEKHHFFEKQVAAKTFKAKF